MPKTKISEFSATPGNNTDIDGINIAEGCAPSGINDAIRELMAQLKDFQAGTAGDSFNGPIGSVTPAAGAFTTLSASGVTTLSGLTASTSLALDASKNVISVTNTGTGNNVLATSPTLVTPNLGTPSALVGTNITGTATNFNINGTVGATTPASGAFTTVAASGAVTLSGGTANGVPYLNGSKVLTTGSALSFDGTVLGSAGSSSGTVLEVLRLSNNGIGDGTQAQVSFRAASTNYAQITGGFSGGPSLISNVTAGGYHALQIGSSEQMRLTSTGLGIGTSSPASRLESHYTSTAPSLSSSSGTGLSLRGSTSLRVNIGSDPSSPFGGWIQASDGGGNAFALNLNPLGGNVGIGTSSPLARLTVSDSTATNGTMTLGNNASYHGKFEYTFSTGELRISQVGGSSLGTTFYTGGTERMRLDSSGNLGLGVTPGAWTTYRAMDIGGGQSVVSYQDAATNTVGFAANALWNGSWVYRQSSVGASRYQLVNNAHNWFTAGSGTAGNPISFSQAMTLDASGNLLVGGTSVYAATMTSYASASRSAGLGLRNSAGTTAGGIFTAAAGSGGGSTDVLVEAAGYLGFNTGGATERARITSGGDLLVGKTAVSGTTAGCENLANGQINAATANLDNLNIYNTTAAAYRFYVNSAGTVFATNTTISAISDIRFKENIRDLNVGLAEVMGLKPRLYDWKEGKGANIKNARGFIAQEFEQVFPDLIDEWKDPSPEGEEPYKSVRQDLIPVLVKAIQEQQALITDLRARVAALETK